MRVEKSSQPQSDVYRLYEDALRLVHKKEFKKARTAFESIRERFPDDLEILAKANEYIRVCDRRLGSAGEPQASGDELIDQGVMYHNLGDYKKALACYTQALEQKNTDKATIHYALAASEAAQGETAKAMENLKKAIAGRPELRFAARNDPDFQILNESLEFRELIKPQKSEV
jgi:tetratricopeptide (TPR) repeat protein